MAFRYWFLASLWVLSGFLVPLKPAISGVEDGPGVAPFYVSRSLARRGISFLIIWFSLVSLAPGFSGWLCCLKPASSAVDDQPGVASYKYYEA